MLTKPATQLLKHHVELAALAASKGLVCWVEHHKRFDPAYSDARARAEKLGPFSFFSGASALRCRLGMCSKMTTNPSMPGYMSQPKSQLETFKSWAGIDSDISYYLNSCVSQPMQFILGYIY